jgi:glycosyltransferase involved in cell wall biosynthesis
MARDNDVHFYFFSAGNTWFWLPEHGLRAGNFPREYLRGFRIGGVRICPSLPFRLLRRPFDILIAGIDGRFAMPVAYLIARLKRKPFVLWTGIWCRVQSRLYRPAFPLTRYLYRHADAIVVYGEHVKRYLMSEGVSEEAIFVAPHSVDNALYSRPVPESEKTSLRQRLGIPVEKKVVLFLGRLEEVKGLPYLIEAFARLRRSDAVLLIAGTGSLRRSLEDLAAGRGIADSVRFAGYVSPEDSVAYYAVADICVLPSVTTPRAKELWGLVVNEAFNQGVPVIATDAVGAAAGGFVRDDLNGIVVPERDTAALARSLELLLDNSALRQRLGENALRTIPDWNQEGMAASFRKATDYAVAQSGRRKRSAVADHETQVS